MKRLLIASALMSMFAMSTARANLIVNGSFEDPNLHGAFYQNFGTETDPTNYGGTSFPSWTVTTNNVDVVSQGFWPAPAASGVQYLDLVGYGSTGGISQSFATTIGQVYDISFAYGNNPGSTTTASAVVDIFGIPGSTPFTHNLSTTTDIGWTIFTGSFTANSANSTIEFTNTVGGNNGGVLLDSINVSAIPEASTWAMMILGFFGLGFLGYRKSSRSSGASFRTA